jgi:hypothetical protein
MLLVVPHQLTYWSLVTSANNGTASSLLSQTLKNQMMFGGTTKNTPYCKSYYGNI